MLKEELWGCFKYIGIPFETLEKMPIRDRKYYILRHNSEQLDKKKDDINNKNLKRTNDPFVLEKMAEKEQIKNKNMRNR